MVQGENEIFRDMKLKDLILTGVALAFTVMVSAQEKEKKTPEQRAETMTTKMAEKFELEGEKKEKLEKVNLEFTQSLEKVKNDKSLSKEQKKEKVKAIMDKRHTDLADVLTAEQLEELKKVEKEKMEKKQQMVEKRKKERQVSPADHAKKKSDHLKQELSLSDDQYTKVYDLTLKVSEKIDVIKKDDTMDQEKKKKFIQGNMKDYRNEMKQILTGEQFERFKAMGKERKEHMPPKGK